jgi:P-type Cu2+ transporter
MSTAAALHARWTEDSHEHAVFVAEGIRCASCAGSIERAVRALPGVEAVRVNAVTSRVSVDWSTSAATTFKQILGAVEDAGFPTAPLAGLAAGDDYRRERARALKRLGLAALGMMQAMMYLGALYGVSDIDPAMTSLMRVAGMIIVTPVLFYSGAPMLLGAWRDLTHRRLSMDVPVAIALLLAWAPSVVNTLRGTGEVYFDSVAMFVFFLSAGRFLEMNVRHRSLSAGEALARSLPAWVTRLDATGAREKVDAAALRTGDRFLVPRGAVVAVDARLEAGSEATAWLDESLLTGESAAAARGSDDLIRGGSVNLGTPLTLVVAAPLENSTLTSIVALLERAQSSRPRMAQAADRAASWFVLAILVLSIITAAMWLHFDPTRAFEAVLAVLVVTCPCALSLATPAVLAAATLRLSRLGMLVTRSDAIERLASVNTVVLDKTGTLTASQVAVAQVRLFGDLSRDRALALAAAVEQASAHPVASAFAAYLDPSVHVTRAREFVGEGMEAEVDGSIWRVGTRSFVDAIAMQSKVAPLASRDDDAVYLGAASGAMAAFALRAPLRDDARSVVGALRDLGLEVVIASGDSQGAVRYVADELGVTQAHARLTPQEKINLVRKLQSTGRRVFMIGDGINDGPVLAAAEASCAPVEGSAIAQCAADLLLLASTLGALPKAVATARATVRVMRQNLGWALAYNIVAVPLAALGLVSPWLAALGMSLSSLAVVLNARRVATEGGGA